MIEIKSSKWLSPTSIIIGGASGSGKTNFVANLITNRADVFTPPQKNVIYFYKVYQEIYDLMKKKNPEILFLNTPPTSIESFKDLVKECGSGGTMVIFGMFSLKNLKNWVIFLLFPDDLEEEMVQHSCLYTEIYTVYSHHLNITPVAIIHNIFQKELRTLSLNIHRMVLLRSPRDISQISHLSRQCFPRTKNYLPSVYNHVMQYTGFPYIIVNFSPNDSKYIKVSIKIFRHEHPMEVFQEGKGTGEPF